jgi:hypothetical protein
MISRPDVRSVTMPPVAAASARLMVEEAKLRSCTRKTRQSGGFVLQRTADCAAMQPWSWSGYKAVPGLATVCQAHLQQEGSTGLLSCVWP